MFFNSTSVASFKFREFRYFILYRFLVTNAYQIQWLITAWWIYQLTHSKLYAGAIGLAEILPSLTVSLFAGHLADKMDRTKIIKVAVSIMALLALALFFIANSTLSSPAKITLVFTIVSLTGLARGVMGPALSALLSQLVKREEYGNAATWNSFTWQLSGALGPLLAGLLFAAWGIAYLELMVFTLCTIALCCVFLIGPKPFEIKIKKGESIKESLKQGVSFVFNHKILLGALSLDMFAVLFGGAVAMLPFFADEVLKTGPEGLGYLRASASVGSILMMLFLAGNPPTKNTGKKLFLSVAMFGVFTIAFALSKNLYLSCFFLFLTGVFDSISVVIRGTILQLYTPDEMRGRVSAVNSVFIGSSNELGMLESGLAGELMGIVNSVVFGGCMSVLVVVIVLLRLPVLYRLQLSVEKH